MVKRTLQGSGIYRILNIVNGKFYIGSSTEIGGRWYDHLWALRSARHANYRLQADYHEFGETAFIAQVVELVPDHGDLLKVEQWYLDDTRCYDPEVGYNIAPTAGNTLGKPQSEATREKIRQKALGRKWSDEALAKMKATFALPEHQERMAAWHRTVENRASVSRTKGGSGYVLTEQDVEKAIDIYEAGNLSIKKVAAAFGVSYAQMWNALHGHGPKFGSQRVSDASIKSGNSDREVAAKISRTLRKVPEGIEDIVREKYATGLYTQIALADEFGVSPEVIHRIVKASSYCFGMGQADVLPTVSQEHKRGPRQYVPAETVKKIREMYATGAYSQLQLRKLLGVPSTTIGRIINGEGHYKENHDGRRPAAHPLLLSVKAPTESVDLPLYKMTAPAPSKPQQSSFQF